MSCLLSFGHGYSAQALTRLLVPQGWQVIGTTRSPEKASKLVEEGVEAIVWPEEDATSGALGEAFKCATHLLISAGPEEEGGDPVLARLTPEMLRLAAQLEWAGYLSTTGVYGDHKGAWVDESTPLNPATVRGQLRVDAEAAWAAIPDLPLHIFRLAGIYGPGRGPFAKVRSGTARRIIKPGQVFSRIHVEDIA
ncbi:MAG: SDR family NAD(P)-dependent oxidoreductase, partial [Pseudomonadota bacterium]